MLGLHDRYKPVFLSDRICHVTSGEAANDTPRYRMRKGDLHGVADAYRSDSA